MFALDTTRSAAPSLTYRAMSVTQNVFSGFKSWNDERQTRKALSKLTSRELLDIGIETGDVLETSHRVGL